MNILYFSPILWNDLKQRPQHIAEELSLYHNIYYIEPSVSLIKSIITKTDLHKCSEFIVNENLIVIRPSGKYRLPKSIDLIDVFGINNICEKKQLKPLIDKCQIVWLGSPIYYSLVKDFKNKKIVYDKMDDYVALTRNRLLKKLIHKNENELIKRADIIFASFWLFYEEIKTKGKSVFYINNAVDPKFLDSGCCNHSETIISTIKDLKEYNKIIFGYIGTVDHWFDYKAIDTILNYSKDFHVFIVGKNCMDKLSHERIYYYDSVPKDELAGVITKFDYCLYTFKKNEFLDTIDPVKMYEYLSLNKKIIAVQSAETYRFREYISLYNNYNELEELVSCLERVRTPFNSIRDVHNFISNNNWEKRVVFIDEIITELLVQGGKHEVTDK